MLLVIKAFLCPSLQRTFDAFAGGWRLETGWQCVVCIHIIDLNTSYNFFKIKAPVGAEDVKSGRRRVDYASDRSTCSGIHQAQTWPLPVLPHRGRGNATGWRAEPRETNGCWGLDYHMFVQKPIPHQHPPDWQLFCCQQR